MKSIKHQNCLLSQTSLLDRELLCCALGDVVAYSRCLADRDPVNEDALLVHEISGNRLVIAVADGVGSTNAADAASRLALQSVSDRLAEVHNQESDQELRAPILDGIERANAELLALGSSAATTLSLVELAPQQMRSYQIGDSISMAVGQRGKIRYQSPTHSPVGYAVEHGFLDEQEAQDHADRHIVCNVVGDSEMSIEMGSWITLNKRDTVLVASDGLSDNLTVEEMCAAIQSGPLLAAAERLADTAGGRMAADGDDFAGKPDDLTFLLFRFR